MTGKRKNKKDMILMVLESQGLLSTTAIANSTLASVILTKDRLNRLEEEGLVESLQTPTGYVYWKLTIQENLGENQK